LKEWLLIHKIKALYDHGEGVYGEFQLHIKIQRVEKI
jgi:hypothetical protein